MAVYYSDIDAKRIIQEHRDVMSLLAAAVEFGTKNKNDIKNLADRMVAVEIMKTLRDMPLDEINREKKGLRIKSLQESGFNNMANVAIATLHQLIAVKGISEEGAKTIHEVARGYVAQMRKGIKIKLNADDRNPDATNLIKAIAIYNRTKETVDACLAMHRQKRGTIASAVADLEAVDGFAKKMFATADKKRRAEDAYSLLSNEVNSGYVPEAITALKRLQEEKNVDDNKAWDIFIEDPISFSNTLEEIAPDLLGNDDSVYGLPEELARQIQDQCYFPDGLLCELRTYQMWGVKYALHQERIILGDDMGLGKTVQAIATFVSLKNTGATHFMVVCPASVITNWCREIVKMSKLMPTKIHGSDREEALASWLETGGVAVTTFETTSHIKLPDDFTFSELVEDEAHYIKNPEAQRTINVKEISKHAQRVIFMTGTALENKVDEMISLVDMLQPEIAKKIEKIAYLSAADQFRKEVAPVYYRRRREDVLTELPEKIESVELCTLLPKEMKKYEETVLSKKYADIRRVSWNVGNPEDSSKARRLLELVDEAENEGRKVIVFSFFLDTIDMVVKTLGDRCMTPINGSVSPQRRQEIIDEFEKAPAGSVLPAQIQSGGTGLNIQTASVVILCEPQFKPSIENQAVARAHRMGQARNVLVYRLICDDTVDEKIMDILKQKQTVFDAFADKSEAAAAEVYLDDKTFGEIIEEEIDRINKRQTQNK